MCLAHQVPPEVMMPAAMMPAPVHHGKTSPNACQTIDFMVQIQGLDAIAT
jgi:hypothetical protein